MNSLTEMRAPREPVVAAGGKRALVMPASPDTERIVLGAILQDSATHGDQLDRLEAEHFSRSDYKTILRRMKALYRRDGQVDRVTLLNELDRHSELKPVGGFAAVVGLDEGLPLFISVRNYIAILAEKSATRRALQVAEHVRNRLLNGEVAAEVIADGLELLGGVASSDLNRQRVEDLPPLEDGEDTEITYLYAPFVPVGAVLGVTGDAGCGKSSLATAWCRDVDVQCLILDRENPRAVVTDRFKRLGLPLNTARVRVWGRWCKQAPPLPDAPEVREWVQRAGGPVIVVVDSLAGFFEGADQNDAAPMRVFLDRSRRIADAGASVIILHHSGKGESAQDYRGSSDFKAAIDVGLHVSNYATTGLGRIVVRPFKERIPVGGEIAFDYAGGRFIREGAREARQTVTDQLTAILRTNPGATARRFDELAAAAGLGRSRGRSYLSDGVLGGTVRREAGPNNLKRHFLEVDGGV